MAHYYPPGHPFHQPTLERADSDCSSTASWRSAPSGCGNSSDSSLGTLSSCGTLFSDSGNSQDGNWRNGRVWTSLAVGSDSVVRGSSRDWSSTTTGLGSGARGGSGGWTDPQCNTGADTEEDEAGGSNLQADRGGQRPYTQQPFRDPGCSSSTAGC